MRELLTAYSWKPLPVKPPMPRLIITIRVSKQEDGKGKKIYVADCDHPKVDAIAYSLQTCIKQAKNEALLYITQNIDDYPELETIHFEVQS